MAESRCRQRRSLRVEISAPPSERSMEAPEEPMNRYISPTTLNCCPTSCGAKENRVLLEQLTELSVTQNQLLMDLLGAVNALTAALLTGRAQI